MDVGEEASKNQKWISNIKFLLVAGGGIFGDGYLNTTIGLVVPMLGYLYWKDNKGAVPAVQGDEIKGSFSIGMVVGQITFGSLGDAIGRHRVYGKELLFTIFGTLLVVLLPWRGISQTGIVAWLSVFRLVTGIGTGGDYPMTSTLSAEHRTVSSRARLVMLVFSFLSLGVLAAGIMLIILLAGFKNAIEADVNKFEYVWRLLFGLGIVPAIFTMYARFRMKETRPYEKYVAKDTALINSNKRNYGTQLRDFREYFATWKHAKVLFATCSSWFLYDIAVYGIGLNQSIILTSIGYGGGHTPWEKMWNIAVGNIIVAFAGSLPGVYVGIFLPDLVGRRNLQFWSCIIAGTLFAIWAGVSKIASSGGLIALFTLAQFALSCGPNITTFLMPVELFPTRVRGSAHGISAASGKAGAVLTAYAFASAVDGIGLQGVLGLFAGLLFLVSLITLLIPEARGKTLEEIEHGVMYKGAADEI